MTKPTTDELQIFTILMTLYPFYPIWMQLIQKQEEKESH